MYRCKKLTGLFQNNIRKLLSVTVLGVLLMTFNAAADVPQVSMFSSYGVEESETVYGYSRIHKTWNPSKYEALPSYPIIKNMEGEDCSGDPLFSDYETSEDGEVCFDPERVEQLKLTVLKPKHDDNPVNTPIMVMFQGLSFNYITLGHYNYFDMKASAQSFAEKGWLVFLVEYTGADMRNNDTYEKAYPTIPEPYYQMVRDNFAAILDMSPGVTKDMAYGSYASARDGKAAIRWIRANAERYGGNPDYITAYGFSAGGQISLALGVTDPGDFSSEVSEAVDPTIPFNTPGVSPRVQTVISRAGGATLPVLRKMAFGGDDRFDSTDAPTQLFHGLRDLVVPYPLTLKLKKKLNNRGIIHELHSYPFGNHYTINYSLKDGLTIDQLAYQFITQQQGIQVAFNVPAYYEEERNYSINYNIWWENSRQYDWKCLKVRKGCQHPDPRGYIKIARKQLVDIRKNNAKRKIDGSSDIKIEDPLPSLTTVQFQLYDKDKKHKRHDPMLCARSDGHCKPKDVVRQNIRLYCGKTHLMRNMGDNHRPTVLRLQVDCKS